MLRLMLLRLWFAFILVSLIHWKQRRNGWNSWNRVVICFHFSIFDPLETASSFITAFFVVLWFAFILVSLIHWKQRWYDCHVVWICCDLLWSIGNSFKRKENYMELLWLAFILVSLIHWKQLSCVNTFFVLVVICFHFSIFDPLETANLKIKAIMSSLWFAFILVSLIHWKQLSRILNTFDYSCDLLSF